MGKLRVLVFGKIIVLYYRVDFKYFIYCFSFYDGIIEGVNFWLESCGERKIIVLKVFKW